MAASESWLAGEGKIRAECGDASRRRGRVEGLVALAGSILHGLEGDSPAATSTHQERVKVAGSPLVVPPPWDRRG